MPRSRLNVIRALYVAVIGFLLTRSKGFESSLRELFALLRGLPLRCEGASKQFFCLNANGLSKGSGSTSNTIERGGRESCLYLKLL